MKKFIKDYESPILLILSFTENDVIRTSNPDGEFGNGSFGGGFSGEDDEFIFGW